MKRVYLISFLVAIISVVILVLNKTDSTKNTVIDAESTSQQSAPDVTSLAVTNQLVSDSVLIDEVTLTKGGFVVIREVYKGKLGQILEVSDFLTVGTHQNVEIDLLEIPSFESVVIAVVYEDDGDLGFNPLLDKRALVNGTVVASNVETGKAIEPGLFSDATPTAKESVATIEYDGTNFSPATVEIQKGDTVTFSNQSSSKMWAASDPHPAHTILPSFDQFSGSESGSTYQYTFDEIGTWAYHDHINPTAVGTIVVTEADSMTDLPDIKNSFGYFETNSDSFAELVDDPEVTTINVHIPYGGEIAGTEAFVPYNDTEALLAALPEDKAAPVAVYCRSGGMSAVAAKELVAAGYANVYDLTGGMNAYRDSGREVSNKNMN